MEQSDYFDWLCEMVCVDGRYNDESYYHLAKILFDEEFYWSLDYDDDRAADGLALRSRYRYEGGTEYPEGTCSVLEMLIALADRMEQHLDELDGECKTPIYFWAMLENLHLEGYSDAMFESRHPDSWPSLKRSIVSKLHHWMDRDIGYDGVGGIFPLSDPKRDQRNVDFWYQANAYILEHYYDD